MEDPAFVQVSSEPDTPYLAPAGEWKLTRWEVNTTGATAGAAVTLLVLRPAAEGSYDVLGTDTDTVGDPLPAGKAASFALARPIAVNGGDALGLYAATPEVTCFFKGGQTPLAGRIDALDAPTAPAPGQNLPFVVESEHRFRLNLAATLRKDPDIAVTAAAPGDATVGVLALLGSTVTNRGPETTSIHFTDTVPPGLRVESALAGSGSCATAGQTVTCRIADLGVGQSAPVAVLVTPTAAGSYVNAVSVAPTEGLVDRSPDDDSASATLEVAPRPTATPAAGTPRRAGPGKPACIVPNLRRVRTATARRLLRRLGCVAGRVRHVYHGEIAKGTVVRTTPRPGAYAAGRKVGLIASAGPPRRHRHRHRAHRSPAPR